MWDIEGKKVLTSKRPEKVGQKGNFKNANLGGELVEHASGRQQLIIRDSPNEDSRADCDHPRSQNQRAACFSLTFSMTFSPVFQRHSFSDVYFSEPVR